MKIRGEYHVTIIEDDGTIMEFVKLNRNDALAETNAAEKIGKCKFWQITYIKQIKS